MDEANGNIGSLWVSLGMETSQLKEGMREAERVAVSGASRINDRLKSMTSGVNAYAQKWAALPLAIGASIFAVQQAFAEFQRFYNMAKEGAKDMRMEEAFRNVAESVGANADEMTQRMVKATGRAVQETELQATAMRGMLGGINEKTLTDLSGAAKIFARSTGQATGDVFNQIINSVIMQMPRQLMRLRVITREEMREIQKAVSMGAIGKEDIAAEIVRKAKERGEQMNISAYDMYSAFSKFGRAWDELIEAGGKLTALVFVPLLEILTPTIDAITGLANILLSVLLPVLKPVYQGIKEIAEMAYDLYNQLKGLWLAVDQGKKSLEDLADQGMILGPLLVALRGWKNVAEAIQFACDQLERWQRLINEAKAGGPNMSPIDNAPSTFFFDKPVVTKMLGSEDEAKKTAAAADKAHSISLLAIRAREVQYEQAKLKSSLEVAKQENAIRLELVKARHAAELKLLDIKSKHEIEMAKRGGATSQEAFNMEMTATAKRNSMTEQNARKEAGLKASIARQEMELELRIDNEKNKYKAETMERERQLAERSAPGSQAAHDKLVELNQFVTHYKKLEKITREGRERIIRARYGGDIEQAVLNAKVAAAELEVTKKERGSVEEMKAVQAAQTVTFEKMSLDTRISTLDIEEKIANIKMDQDEGLISEIGAQEKLLDQEMRRYDRLKEEEKIINDRAKILETISGKKFDPFKDSLGDLLRMNEEIQNGSQYNDIIKATWKEITDKIIENYEALKKQKTTVEQTASAMERMKSAAIMEIGPVAGMQWFTEQAKAIEANKEKFRKAGIDETTILKYEIEQRRQVQLQYYQWQLENADNLNAAMVARANLMLDEVRNAYTMWANAVADTMQRSFSDFFFDVMESKVKSLQEYLTSFTQSMNRQIADFLSKKFTGEILKLVFGIDETQNMQVATINAAVLNVGSTNGGGAAPVVESSGFAGAISDMWTGVKNWFGGFDIFHEGGVVGASSDSKKLVGGLQHDEVVAILQKGEVVIPRGGIADFIEKYAGARQIGGSVQAGMQYLIGEGGQELFAPRYGGPTISNVIARKAEEASAAKRVAAMEAKELAQYKKEYDEYRKYELEREAWEKEQREKANQQQEGGGLMSYLPTLLMSLGLKYGGGLMGGLTWLGDLLGITSVASPTVGGASAGAGVTMGHFMELEAASMLSEAPVAGWAMEAGMLGAEAAEGYSLASVGAGSAEEFFAASGAGVGSELGFMSALPGIGMAMGAGYIAGQASFALIPALDRVLSSIGLGEVRGGTPYWEMPTEQLMEPQFAGMPFVYDYLKDVRGVDPSTFGVNRMSEEAYQTSVWQQEGKIAPEGVNNWIQGNAARGGTFGAGKRILVGELGREIFLPTYHDGGVVERISRPWIEPLEDAYSENYEYNTKRKLSPYGEISNPEPFSLAGWFGSYWQNLEKPSGDRTGQLMEVASWGIPGPYKLGKYMSKGSENLARGIFELPGLLGGLFEGTTDTQGLSSIAIPSVVSNVGERSLMRAMSSTFDFGTLLRSADSLSILKKFLPFFAEGGPIRANKISVIGERGPEIFVPQVSGTVIPNDITEKLLSMPALFSGDGAGGFVGNTMSQPTSSLGVANTGFVGSYFSNMAQGPEFAMRAAGGHVSGGHPYIVGEGGVEAFVSNLPRFHNGGMVGGGRVAVKGVPNQIVNVTNRIEGKQQATPVAQNNSVTVNVQSLDGADAYRVLSNNRDALASIFSEMRLDNNSRLRR